MLEVLLGHLFRIEVGAQRLSRRHAGEECLVLVDVGPGAFDDPEVMQTCLAQGREVFLQAAIKVGIAAPHLFQKDVVQEARRLHQFHQRLPIAAGKS